MPFARLTQKLIHRGMMICAALAVAACGGLAGEPEIIATLPPVTAVPPTPIEAAEPLIPPPAITEEVSDPAPPAATVVSTSGAVTGRVLHGTDGFSPPPDMPVTLFVTDGRTMPDRYETTTAPDGSFRFDDVLLSAEQAYIAVVPYQERTFTSDLVSASGDTLDLPITLYETTEDPAAVIISGMVSQITAVGDGLQVVQVINFRNTSDRMFASDEPVRENQFASVVISLPPGAVVIGFPNDSEQRFIVTEDQSTVIDTAPVLPGADHIVQMVYFLPYTDGAIIEQGMNYAVEGPVRLLLRPDSVIARSDQLEPIGPQTVGETTYTGYGGVLALEAGDAVIYELAGTGVLTVAEIEAPVVSSNNLIIVIVVVLVGQAVLVSVLYVFYRRRKPAATDDEQKARVIDALTHQIAELDEAHNRGDINHDLYHHRRRDLKARLTELIGEENKP